MGETETDQELQVDINGTMNKPSSPSPNCLGQHKWWLQMIIYAFLVLAGQSIGTLLGRIYFVNGGQSEWMATLVQVAGFPILLPFLFFTTNPEKDQTTLTNNKNNSITLISFYIAIGIFAAGVSMLYSIGLQYLPVTTFTLICASQLAFNALFSYFLNKQKFTPYIVNSLVLLTISSVLLVFQTGPTGDNPNKTTRRKYVGGCVCTLAASSGYALLLSIVQLAFQRIIRNETLRAVVHLAIYQNSVATLVILVGLFASGDWKRLGGEMRGYESGHVSYVMNLVGTAVCWQAFAVGGVGLIFKVSSLFANVIGIVGVPLPPVLAVIFLNEKLSGLKAVSMLLAVWGFVSYMYQHYLDDVTMKKKEKNGLSKT